MLPAHPYNSGPEKLFQQSKQKEREKGGRGYGLTGVHLAILLARNVCRQPGGGREGGKKVGEERQLIVGDKAEYVCSQAPLFN